MASINTNAAAMTALQTLTATNKNLATTQNRISTGLRVDTASDNAAYWSIATTMRSDNRSMSAVQDALGFGAAQVDVAYTAMDAVKDTLDNMKAKIVAASQPDIDKAKIQEEIKQLQNDLKTYAESASFSGGNWLNVSEAGTQKVVASFMRDAANTISLGTIDVDTSKTALFNSTADTFGLLEGNGNYSLNGLATGEATESTWDGGAGTGATFTLTGFQGPITLNEGDTISFDMSFGGDTAKITLEGSAAGVTFADADALAAALQTAIAAEFAGATASNSGGTITITAGGAGVSTEGQSISISNLRADAGQIDVTTFDITNASAEDLQGLLSGVDKALLNVTTAASDLGAIKTRIDSQQTFVGKIMDAIDRGVGQLVDADMQEESARLSALQVQQQLGIQSLSIANSNAQNILSLFR